MAGETPRAHNARTPKKRRPNWQDDRSTGKYYESGDVSAIQNQHTVADSTLKPGQVPVPRTTKLPKADDRRADKYYANAAPQAPTLQQIQRGQKLGPPPVLGAPRPKLTAPQQQEVARRQADPNASLTIAEPHEVNGVMQEVVSRLSQGEKGVVVYVQKGNSNLLKRARAALEMLVTREVITEEMYHDVRLSYALGEGEQAAVDDKLGAPAPAGEVKLPEQNVESADPEDFLAGIKDEEEAEAAMANAGTVTVTEVDTTNDVQDSPAPEYPSAPPAEDDDDSDFLAPTSAPAVNPTLTEEDRNELLRNGWKEEPSLKQTNDELDRAVPTDEPVKVVDKEQDSPAAISVPFQTLPDTHFLGDTPVRGQAANSVVVDERQEVPISEPAETSDDEVGLSGGIQTPLEAMDGIGDKPKAPKKPGKRSGRGAQQ